MCKDQSRSFISTTTYTVSFLVDLKNVTCNSNRCRHRRIMFVAEFGISVSVSSA